MIVFPLIRLVGLKAATASSRVETLPMFVRNRPSRARWTIALSWARSDSTTKSTARPSAGRASGRLAVNERLVGIRDPLEHHHDFERPLGSAAFVRDGERLSIGGHLVPSGPEHLTVHL